MGRLWKSEAAADGLGISTGRNTGESLFLRLPNESTLASSNTNANQALIPKWWTDTYERTYERNAIMIPLLEFLLGIFNNLGGSSWTEFQVKGPHPVSPPNKSLLGGVVEAMPWNIKIFVAFTSDILPIYGRRRVPYLIIGMFLQGSCWMVLGFFGDLMTFPYLCLEQFLSTIGQMMAGVMCDTLIVENIKHETGNEIGKLQATTYLMFAVGGFIGTLLSGWLPQYAHISYQAMFVIVGAGKMSLIGVCLLMRDPKVIARHSLPVKQTAMDIWNTVRLHRVMKPLVFVFIFAMMPGSSSSFNSYLIQGNPICKLQGSTCVGRLVDTKGNVQYNDWCSHQTSCNTTWGGLDFTVSEYSYVGMLGSAGSVLGNWLFRVWLIRAQWHCMFASTVILASMFSALQLILMFRNSAGLTLNEQAHLPNLLFALGDDVIMATANQLINLPILILMARLCPEGAEGTVYALATSVQGVGGTIGGVWSKIATHHFDIQNYDFSRLWQLTLLTSTCKIACLPLLWLVPKSINDTQDTRNSTISALLILGLFVGGLSFSLYQVIYTLAQE